MQMRLQSLVKQGLKDGIRHFIAVGGDGTVNTLAKHLVHTDAVLGIILRGSGNGPARHFNITKDIQGALTRVLKTISRRLTLFASMINGLSMLQA